MNGNALISVTDLKKYYKGEKIKALDGVSAEIADPLSVFAGQNERLSQEAMRAAIADRLEPALAPSALSPLAPAHGNEPALSGAEPRFVGEGSGSGSRAWLWAGLGLAALGGFLIWKSKQPDHRGIEMR